MFLQLDEFLKDEDCDQDLFQIFGFPILKEEDSDQYLFQRRKLSMSFQMKELLNITDPQSLEGIRGDVNGKAAVLMKLAQKKLNLLAGNVQCIRNDTVSFKVFHQISH